MSKKMQFMTFLVLLSSCLAPSFLGAGQQPVEHIIEVNSTQDPMHSLGTVLFKNTSMGLLIIPNLHGLTPGLHGFHLHASASCGNKGQAAGGHWDPEKTGKHAGPYGNGHLGDLPVLAADKIGDVTTPVLAPRLKLKNLFGHTIIIHAGGDNYSDKPLPLGGGGARVGCSVITKPITNN